MMKNLIFTLISLFAVFSYSQSPYSPINGAQKVIIENYDNTKGTPYIYNKWNEGILVLNDTIFSVQKFISYDAYNNRLLLKLSNDDEVISINDPSVTGFAIIDGKQALKHDFVKLDKTNFYNDEVKGEFFEIVYNLKNKNYLIKKTTKVLFDPNKSSSVQTINNLPLEFQSKTVYYIKDERGLYVEIKLRKKDILKLLNKHSDLTKAYINSRKFSFSSESDVVNLVNYYHSL